MTTDPSSSQPSSTQPTNQSTANQSSTTQPDTTQPDTAQPSIQQQLRAIVDAARERRAEDVVVLDLSAVSSTLDYFVICTATAGLQLNAVQENVRQKALAAGLPRPSVEGPSERWLLLAFGGSVVVHIMTKDAREYYDLEGLWSDAQALEFPEAHA